MDTLELTKKILDEFKIRDALADKHDVDLGDPNLEGAEKMLDEYMEIFNKVATKLKDHEPNS